MDWTKVVAPDLASIAAMAQEVVSQLPTDFRAAAAQVVIRVEDVASDEVLDDLGVDDPFELSGFYEGVPLAEKSPTDPAPGPDSIWLFRRALLDEWAARGNVGFGALVAHVVVHELAHHFGWTEDEIAVIDRGWT